jgi:hypothetical protein
MLDALHVLDEMAADLAAHIPPEVWVKYQHVRGAASLAAVLEILTQGIIRDGCPWDQVHNYHVISNNLRAALEEMGEEVFPSRAGQALAQAEQIKRSSLLMMETMGNA